MNSSDFCHYVTHALKTVEMISSEQKDKTESQSKMES